MNKACTVDRIRQVHFARGNPRWIEAAAADETAGQFSTRLGEIIKAEVAGHFNTPVDWGKLDLRNNLCLRPVSEDNKLYCYLGCGVIGEYNLAMIPAILKATKGKKLKDYHTAIDQYALADTFSVDEVDRLEVVYQDDLVLKVDVTKRRLQWKDSIKLHDALLLENDETPSGLMQALEAYGGTGEIDDSYAMFMQIPFGIEKQALNLNHLSRVFAQDLGL